LYGTLIRFGFAEGQFKADPNDGLALKGTLITNAVRCVPPENKPTTVEIKTCNDFLIRQISALPRLRAIVALGRIAHDATLTALGERKSRCAFRHGAEHDLGRVRLFDSYHCSRYNTNTGVLTPEMFENVFRAVRAYLG
ncbi:MAG: uracil-DNA glycosylase, partial [Rhodobacteraceae bacterium]|nr:uracil-DNA glycosylase [Paracoccaceae bacterium]